MSLADRIRNSQLWKSIFRHPLHLDRENRIRVVLTNLILHLHPVSLKSHAVHPRFTWCMGGITAFLSVPDTTAPPVQSEQRWLDGLYLDVPEEWDDPYRFFRW